MQEPQGGQEAKWLTILTGAKTYHKWKNLHCYIFTNSCCILIRFILTLQLFFVLFTGSIVHSKCSPTEFTPIQVSHGTKCCLLVLVFTEAITLWLSRLPIIYQPGGAEPSIGHKCYIYIGLLLTWASSNLVHSKTNNFITLTISPKYDLNIFK